VPITYLGLSGEVQVFDGTGEQENDHGWAGLLAWISRGYIIVYLIQQPTSFDGWLVQCLKTFI